jgi:uncharacterized DUF497 family protein
MELIYGLEWDEDAEDHIARHGVTVDEADEAVRNISYAKKSSDYLMIIGQTDGGRYLSMFLDYEGGGFWYVVTCQRF